MNILVVEDDAGIRNFLEAFLAQESGWHITTVANGQEALKVLEEQSVQIVITDWGMDQVDGLTLIRRIRAASYPDYIFILLMTGHAQREEIVRALKLGADDCLIKPFDLDELQARVLAGERRIRLEQRLRAARDEAVAYSKRDSLTGVLNRAAITEQAEAALALARREQRPVSLGLLDLNHFKRVNDEHGHLVGDEMLRVLTQTISRCIRSADWLGRWGGDEFLLIFAGTGREGAAVVAQRVQTALKEVQLALPDGRALSVLASIGLAPAEPPHYPALDTLLERADGALYHAKERADRGIAVWES